MKSCGVCGVKHCFWCGYVFSLQEADNPNHPRKLTRDHYPSRANRKDNKDIFDDRVVPACRQCNEERGTDDTWQPYHEIQPSWVTKRVPPKELLGRFPSEEADEISS